MSRRLPAYRWLTLALVVAGCAGDGGDADRGDAGGGDASGERPASRAQVEAALHTGMRRIAARTDSVDGILRPLPLLTAAQESALRRYPNAQQLQRARALGVPRPSSSELESLEREGRLVRLQASTPYWIVGELDYSAAYVTPDARALLTEIGERFQERLDDRGLSPFRFEISSALRTADEQAELREINPNAAGGVSTHEYGTTVDLLYSRFAAPEDVDDWVDAGGVRWLEDELRRFAVIAAERVAARRSHELKAILGELLAEMQSEGKVMVTLERRQPVFHMTVARRY